MLDYICWSDYLSADALLLKCTTKIVFVTEKVRLTINCKYLYRRAML